MQDPREDPSADGAEWADAEPGIAERLETDEVREILLEEILRLPEAFRVALTLFLCPGVEIRGNDTCPPGPAGDGKDESFPRENPPA